MEKTKIIATYGPSLENDFILKNMISNGLDVLRINMSFTTREECLKIIEKIKKIDSELNTFTSIMLDTRGNNITISSLKENTILTEGEKVKICKDDILGDKYKFSTNYSNFVSETKIGSTLKINDGLVELEVINKTDDYLECNIISGGEILKGRKIISNSTYKKPFLTPSDYEDIVFACQNKDIDFIALSSVKNHEDVLSVNDILIEYNNDHIGLISKIETKESLEEIDDIISLSDGIMVARGDLGVEVPIERVPGIQKMIINKCHSKGKISIVATEMMSSMSTSKKPTRAEVSDVANAVLDGCDAVMLSGETTIGKYPLETLITMGKIINSTEEEIDYLDFLDKAYRTEKESITGVIAYDVATSASSLKAKVIVTPTLSGATAKKISRFRPECLIMAASPSVETIKSLNLNFGVVPVLVDELNSLEKIMKKVTLLAKKRFNLEEKDIIIITGSYPFIKHAETNFMQITKVGDNNV